MTGRTNIKLIKENSGGGGTINGLYVSKLSLYNDTICFLAPTNDIELYIITEYGTDTGSLYFVAMPNGYGYLALWEITYSDYSLRVVCNGHDYTFTQSDIGSISSGNFDYVMAVE